MNEGKSDLHVRGFWKEMSDLRIILEGRTTTHYPKAMAVIVYLGGTVRTAV